MAWPTGQDYQEAVQNPRLAFLDIDLKGGRPELDKIGLPKVSSGQFACVFKIHCDTGVWAAKCFTSETADQQERYSAISQHLSASQLPQAIPFSYFQNGINVRGKLYPLVKMQWVQGESLSTFIGRNVGYPETLISLAKVWLSLLDDLKRASIAHGDLQHGNVVVVGDQLKLLDYDGMYVPRLAGKQSSELGHRNYQLPSRGKLDFGPNLDNFSSWVIYVSLIALSVHPVLWATYSGGDECIIFRKEDFVNPSRSPLIKELRASSNVQLRSVIELFISLFGLFPGDIPALDGAIAHTGPYSKSAPLPSTDAWWNDHKNNVRQSATNATVASSGDTVPFTDPSWILDLLTEAPHVKVLPTPKSLTGLRIMILGSISLSLVLSILTDLSLAQAVVFACCICGLNILLCYVRFTQEPIQADLRAFRAVVADFARSIQDQQSMLIPINADRLAQQEKLLAAEKNAAIEKAKIDNAAQADLMEAQARLNTAISSLNSQRSAALFTESVEINRWNSTIGAELAEQKRKLANLDTLEAEELNKLNSTVARRHVLMRLQGYEVLQCPAPGISKTLRTRLHIAGYKTAADIDRGVIRVTGIGPMRQATLLDWRNGIERHALNSIPQLNPQERAAVQERYRQQKIAIGSSQALWEKELAAKVAEIRVRANTLRAGFDKQESDCRQTFLRRQDEIQRNAVQQRANADGRTAAIIRQTQLVLEDLAKKAGQLQKHVFSLRWQSARHENEGQRFSGFTFRNYLWAVVHS